MWRLTIEELPFGAGRVGFDTAGNDITELSLHGSENTISVAAPLAEAASREELPEGTAMNCRPPAR
jgi:hypothetical protein